MPTRYELRNRGRAAAPARNTARLKKAARVLSQRKMKESALLKQIEARYAEAKACVASDSLDYFETHDELDMFMIQHAIHFRENPLDTFLYDNGREIRFRDPLARRSFVAWADDGELYVPGIPSDSTLPLFGQPVPQIYPRTRRDGQIVQTSAGGDVPTNSHPAATANAAAVMDHPSVSTTSTTATTTAITTITTHHPPTGADSIPNPPRSSHTSENNTPHTLSQQAESSDSEAAADSDSSSSVSNSRPSGIILRLTGLQSAHPRIQVLKRKAPEEDSASDAPASKRSRASASTTPEHPVSTNQPQQTPEQESSEGTTSLASSTSSEGSGSDDEGGKPQRSCNNPAGSKSAGGVVASGTSMSLRKRKVAVTYAEDDSEDSPPAKRRRAISLDSASSSSSTESRSTPGPSTALIMPTTTASTPTATTHTMNPSASSAATASAAAPTNQYRTRDDPVVGANGFQLIGKQHFFTVGYDQTEFLTQRYTVVENGVRSGVRTHTWEGNRGKTASDIDWNDKKTISRLNQWLAQWMRRSCGCGTMRPNVNKLRWTEEEYDWLRQYVADHPERPSRKQVTVDFNNHFRGRVFTYIDNGGEQVTMPAREDRQTEAIFTAMDRKKIGWRHLEN